MDLALEARKLSLDCFYFMAMMITYLTKSVYTLPQIPDTFQESIAKIALHLIVINHVSQPSQPLPELNF